MEDVRKPGGGLFAAYRDAGLYTVDRSGFIGHVMDMRGSVAIARPRGWGKTMNLSMLGEYLDIDSDPGAGRFEGLAASKRLPADPHWKAHPVLMLDLGPVVPGKDGGIEGTLRGAVLDAMLPFSGICRSRSLSADDRDAVERLLRGGLEDGAVQGLSEFVEVLYRAYGAKVAVLIDDYDAPLIRAFEAGRYGGSAKAVAELMSSMSSNGSVEKTVAMGTFLCPEAVSFPGIAADSMISPVLEDFGVTDAEMRLMSPDDAAEAKERFGGYPVRGSDTMSVQDVVRFTSGLPPSAGSWNASELLQREPDLRDALCTLLRGDAVVRRLDCTMPEGWSSMSLGQAYSMMVQSGLLTAAPSEGGSRLTVPNRRSSDVLRQVFLDSFPIGRKGAVEDLCRALLGGDACGVSEALAKTSQSLGDLRALTEAGNSRHLALSMSTHLGETYEADAGRKSGRGSSDLVLTPHDGNLPTIVMEMRRCRPGESPSKTAERAMRQIRDRAYFGPSKERVMIYGVGLASDEASAVFGERSPDAGPAGASDARR